MNDHIEVLERRGASPLHIALPHPSIIHEVAISDPEGKPVHITNIRGDGRKLLNMGEYFSSAILRTHLHLMRSWSAKIPPPTPEQTRQQTFFADQFVVGCMPLDWGPLAELVIESTDPELWVTVATDIAAHGHPMTTALARPQAKSKKRSAAPS